MAASIKKVVTSAICIIPPSEIWPPIQQIRAIHDRGYIRWPPHINLIYPFAPNNQVPSYLEKVKEAVKTIQPFSIKYQEFKHFKHGQSSYTMWLHPDPHEKVQELQLALVKALPFFDDQNALGKPQRKAKAKKASQTSGSNDDLQEKRDSVVMTAEEFNQNLYELPGLDIVDGPTEETQEASTSHGTDGEATINKKKYKGPQNVYTGTEWGLFTPHLSVGQWQKNSVLEEKKAEFTSNWNPLEMIVDRVHIITRLADEPFEVRYTVKFDGEIIPGKVVLDENDLQAPPEFSLFVRPLPKHCTIQTLVESVKAVDPSIALCNVAIIKNPVDGTCKGYGFASVMDQASFNKLRDLTDTGKIVIGDKAVNFHPSEKKQKNQNDIQASSS